MGMMEEDALGQWRAADVAETDEEEPGGGETARAVGHGPKGVE